VGTDTLTWNASDGHTYAATDATARIAVDANGRISGWVYLDTNNNGRRDADEIGLPGAVLRLSRKDGQGHWVELAGISPVLTAADGSYVFDNLPPGTYEIRQAVPPSNYLDGKDTAGSLGGTVGTDRIFDITLGANSQGTDYLFGKLGLRSRLVSQRLFLASTPAASQILRSLDRPPSIDLNGPENPGNDSTATYTVGGAAVPIAAADGPHGNPLGATVTDAQDGWLASMTLTLGSRPDGDAEMLAADTSGTNLQASYRSGVLTLQGAAPAGDYQKVLRSVTYWNTAPTPTAGKRIIAVRASDGVTTSGLVTATVTIYGGNSTTDLRASDQAPAALDYVLEDLDHWLAE